MNGIFEKFGLYDFMAILGPGEITVAYYCVTLQNIYDKFFVSDNISKSQFFLLLFTAGAYLAGIIIHELGKYLSDVFDIFNPNKVLACINRDYRFDFINRINPIIGIQMDLKKSMDNFNNELTENNFEEVISALKYSKESDTQRIDKYHSIYALARGLMICFGIHILIYIVYLFNFKIDAKLLIAIFATDIVLLLLFFFRAYRYYFSWIKNVYIQYYQIYLNSEETIQN